MAAKPVQQGEGQRLWTKEFIFLFFARTVNTMTYYLLATTLVIVVYDVYQAEPWLAGVVIGIYAFGKLAGRLLVTRYIDIVGRKRMMMILSVGALVVVVSYFFPVSIWLFMVMRFLHGVCMGVFANTISAVGISMIPKSRYSEGLNYFSLSITIAAALGPLIGMNILLIDTAPYYKLFGVALAIVISVLLIVTFLKIPEVELTDKQRAELTKGVHVNQFIEPKSVPMALVMGLVVSLCYISVPSFLTPFAEQFDMVEFAAWYFAVYTVVLVVIRPITGKIMDRHGDNVIVYPAFFLFIIALVVLAYSTNAVMLYLSAVLMAFGQGCLSSCGQVIITRNVAPHRLPMALSTYLIINDIGNTIGVPIMGAFVPSVGYSGVFLISAASVLVMFIAYYLVRKAQDKELAQGESGSAE
ncbi:MAG: MFS transporter [Eggerthellaceae bacterium]|nr:MFS transporter [Eggerthellaceae bacterium]